MEAYCMGYVHNVSGCQLYKQSVSCPILWGTLAIDLGKKLNFIIYALLHLSAK